MRRPLSVAVDDDAVVVAIDVVAVVGIGVGCWMRGPTRRSDQSAASFASYDALDCRV